MPLPDLAVDHISASIAAIKKGGGLEFHIIPPKADKDAPWIIIAKLGKGRALFSAAMKQARKAGTFNTAKAVSGRVEKHQKRLFFVVEKSAGGLQSRLGGRWPKALKNEEDASVKKLASLLRGIQVRTEEQWSEVQNESLAEASYDTETDTDGGADFVALSSEELESFFGPDAPEVTKLSETMASLNESLPLDSPVTSVDAQALVSKALGSEAETLMGRLDEMIPDFLKMITKDAPTSSAPLKTGAPVLLKDAMLGLATQYGQVLRQLESWEKWVGDAEFLSNELDEMQSEMETESWNQETDDPRYVETLDRHNEAFNNARAAQDRALTALNLIEAQYNAITESQE